MQLATSADYYFGADSIALRATFRFGAKIADTEACGQADRRDTRQLADLGAGVFEFLGAAGWAGSVSPADPATPEGVADISDSVDEHVVEMVLSTARRRLRDRSTNTQVGRRVRPIP